MSLFLDDNSGAIFSECRKYRYVLWRKWNNELPMGLFIGLNPSRANETKQDNTITKVMKVAANNGLGGIYMMNLFALVSPYPKDLKECQDPVQDNDKYLLEYGMKAGMVVFCWGNFKEAEQRANEVEKLFNEPRCFVQNINGSPKHPLYCKDDTVLQPYYKQKVKYFQ